MLGFLEKLTLRPGEVGAADAEALRSAGVSRAAAVDALYVAACFNVITRLADAFAFTPISTYLGKEGLLRHEATFLERGYV